MSHLALVPARGERVHEIRPVIGRPLPAAGNQVVWPTKCGRRVFGKLHHWCDVGDLQRCKNCTRAF